MKDLTPSVVWRVTPALLLALDEHLGPPVDSYVNGTQTWLTPEPTSDSEPPDELTLEWRLHPCSGFRAPTGCSHYELWDEVVASISEDPDAAEIVVGEERRSLTSLWEGLECFPAFGDEIEPAGLVAEARAVLPTEPTSSGLVDHGRIGREWERSGGSTSIIGLLLEELGVDR